MDRAGYRRAAKRAYLNIRRRVRPVVTTTCGPHRLTYTTRDSFIGSDLFLYGSWERHLTTLFPAFELAGKAALDVGANIGTYTVRLSDSVGPTGAVIALEPDPQTAEWLRQNVEQNSCTNVTVIQAAAGEEISTASFRRDTVNRGNHQVVDGSEPHDLTIDVLTIDSLTADLPDGSVGFIKIDVQGFEHGVLLGARGTLERNPDLVLQLELSADEQGGAVEIVRLIRELGWDGFEVLGDRFTPMHDAAAYDWPDFRGQCDLLLASDRNRLHRRLQDAVRGEIRPRP